MARAFIIMLDSVGIGASEDAAKYGDVGADTLRHIAEYCLQDSWVEKNNRLPHEKRHKGKDELTGICLPNLARLGLNEAAIISQGKPLPGLKQDRSLLKQGRYGCAKSLSLGKDTQSGHWELAGVPVFLEWGYFQSNSLSFPKELLDQLIKCCHLPGILGNCHASGSEIINRLGIEHQKSKKPIVYTSADSVFQIAAHEETIPVPQLYSICQVARKLVDAYHIGRVIARPFLGSAGKYYRTYNRRDYAIPPFQPTLLEKIIAAGGSVIAIGKVADIYAHRGISKTIKADGNKALCQAFLQEAKTAPENSLTFVNLVDFDTLFGHRRDIKGYAQALEAFDRWLPLFEAILRSGDLSIITADHGCDPSWSGYDHTREHVPVIAFGPDIIPGAIGLRETLADIGQSIAVHLNLGFCLEYGVAFIP